MTKKIFAQPEMMVVKMSNRDIITDSTTMNVNGTFGSGVTIAAPGQRGLDFESWYEGY